MNRGAVIVPWLSLVLLAQGVPATDHEGARNFPSGTGGINAPWQHASPYLVLVSIDGFRWDYPRRFPTATISRIIREGTRAERLLPVWPTLTFPNHYSLVTGLLPNRHGLVANDFYVPESGRWYSLKNRQAVQDGSFYAGEPLWVAAEAQGMVTASFFWVGSEADIGGIHPSHWKAYDKKVPGTARVDQALAWLSLPPERRPHLVTLYFEEVDDHAHWTGIGSPEFLGAMDRVDSYLEWLLEGVRALPHGGEVNIVIVSDHGQMGYTDAPPLILEEHIPLGGLDLVDGGCYVFAWQRRPDPEAARATVNAINDVWRHGKAYTPETAPPAWGIAGNPRFPQLVFQADPGYGVLSRTNMRYKISAGDHGWAPDTPEMHGILLGVGPAFPAATELAAVRTVDVFPLLAHLLELASPATVDSDPRALEKLLGSAPPRAYSNRR